MRVRFAALLDEAVVVLVWVTSAGAGWVWRGALRLVGGVGQAGSPVWLPGLAFCPVKEPWGATSAEIAFSKQR